MSQLPPIRRQVVVPGTSEVAFKIFTDEIGRWWPPSMQRRWPAEVRYGLR